MKLTSPTRNYRESLDIYNSVRNNVKLCLVRKSQNLSLFCLPWHLTKSLDVFSNNYSYKNLHFDKGLENSSLSKMKVFWYSGMQDDFHLSILYTLSINSPEEDPGIPGLSYWWLQVHSRLNGSQGPNLIYCTQNSLPFHLEQLMSNVLGEMHVNPIWTHCWTVKFRYYFSHTPYNSATCMMIEQIAINVNN